MYTSLPIRLDGDLIELGLTALIQPLVVPIRLTHQTVLHQFALFVILRSLLLLELVGRRLQREYVSHAAVRTIEPRLIRLLIHETITKLNECVL